MKNRLVCQRAVVVGFLLLLAGCFTPNSFVKTAEPAWTSIIVRSDLTYDQAWDAAVDYMVTRFNFETLSRQDGYIRTEWNYNAAGKQRRDYRVRLFLKFSLDRSRVEIKTEAEYGGPDQWILGVDARMLETIKTGLTGVIGSANK